MIKTIYDDSNDTMRLVGYQAIENDNAVVEIDDIVSAYLEDPDSINFIYGEDSLRSVLKCFLLSVANDAYLLGVIHGKQIERKKRKR